MLPAPSDLTRWRRLLYATLGGPNPFVSWLEPVWHGEPEVARVVLYQVYPARATPPLFWGERQRVVAVKGCPVPDARFRIEPNVDILTWRQWQLFERFGCIAQPYWIVQGHRGGHKRQFTQIEARTLRAMNLPDEPPTAGDLPFAPVDQRVIRALIPLNAMRVYAKAKALYERTPDDFDAEERDAVVRGSQQLNAWLSEQVAQAFDDVLTYRRRPHDLFERVGGAVPDLERLESEILSATSS